MIRKLLLMTLAIAACSYTFSQQRPPTYEEGEEGFDGSRLFIGGSLNLGFASGTFNVGGVPEIGYSISEMLDIGLGINLNYYTISAEYNGGLRQRSFNYGGGPFIRFYPVKFLFLQGQFEQNWIKTNLRDDYGSIGVPGQSYKLTHSASSVLAGIGYSQRIIGQSNFYTAILVDLNNNPNSPYRNGYSNNVIPIIRAGFNFYLKGHQR